MAGKGVIQVPQRVPDDYLNEDEGKYDIIAPGPGERVIPREGVTPFWVDEEGKNRFPLYWCRDWWIPKVNDLERDEELFAELLKELWGGKDQHLSAKMLLREKPSFVRTEIEKVADKSKRYNRLRNSLLVKTWSPTIEVDKETHQLGNIKTHNRNMEAFSATSLIMSDLRNSTYSGEITVSMDAARKKLRGAVVVPNAEVQCLRTHNASLEAEKRVIEMAKFALSGKLTKLEARLPLGVREVDELKENIKKLEEDRLLEYEKHKVMASKFFTLLEEHKKLSENQRKLQKELQESEEERIQVTKDALEVVKDVVENLKHQIKLFVPDFDNDSISPDYKVVDGKVVDEKGAEVLAGSQVLEGEKEVEDSTPGDKED
ncbi:hypothetical protein PIB30_022379 [Stylosanthes scabra]|uniref:Uncharacterized protein n=1 Tax=Stylosanthes scabra TaxID=79078 RepID=A0ABU6X931_9FABA|nr:hypothetical protein [Stylosanthes scabra]